MTDLKLYLVKADKTDFHDFETAVVYATSPDDAIAITLAEIDRTELPMAEGRWEPPADGATLSAVEVPAVRGPILGHATNC